ncbi:hypothetical protein TrST_g10507 [Triparma strigata]|uniref:tRNA pseudouridine(55) synthase n=1 Tax=Triparma strigata TaxID=1606541 RepID=A0A9W7B7G0_9STRA|nr:hypothetical protein TrST_g10507 [Triparma strigata]
MFTRNATLILYTIIVVMISLTHSFEIGFSRSALRRTATKMFSVVESSSEKGVSEPNCKVSGLVPILKPTNWTSQDVVAFVRKTLEMEAKNRLGTKKRPKIKVGHGGTLDPLATGVLVLGIGKGTKVMGSYLSGPKSYVAEFSTLYETDTLDTEGKVVKTSEKDLVLDEKVLETFRGEIMQKPPMYSALRKDGKRLYELAREGKDYEDVDVPERPVVVHELRVEGTDDLRKFKMECVVGGGTYIRSLIRDIAYAHETVGTMTMLERTVAGGFGIEDCISLRCSAEEIYEKAREVNEEKGIEF